MTCKPCRDVLVLPNRVSIEKPRDNPGADGHTDLENPANWRTVDSRACRFVTKGGREGMVFQQVRAEVTHVIEMRSDPVTRGILPTWRLRMDCRVFNVTAAYDKDERKQTVYVEVTEVK